MIPEPPLDPPDYGPRCIYCGKPCKGDECEKCQREFEPEPKE